MSTLETLVRHQHSCEECKKNPASTPFDDLKLCPEGERIKREAVRSRIVARVGSFLVICSLMIGGASLIGSKLGSEVGVGILLVALSLKLTVKPD